MHRSLFHHPSLRGALVAAFLAAVVLAGRSAPRALGSSAAPSDSFQPVGKLVQANDGAHATLLNDGTVLVTGGNNYGTVNGLVASAERFDPRTNQFSSVGNMTARRDANHQAVRLQDGRVLITGGASDPDSRVHLRSAELFDPSTHKFTAVADMAVDRAAHTATLLHNGQVLIAGGFSTVQHRPLAQAELFDPATGTFQATGDMTTARYLHSAVGLPDGRVVLLGGEGGPDGTALTSVDIYDPGSGTFSAQGDLVETRFRMTATLLPDGRILAVGGQYDNGSNPQTAGARKSVEIYDPVTGQSAITDMMADPRALHVAAALPDGRVLVAGGSADGAVTLGNGLKTAALIDPVTGKVTPTVSMSATRVSAAAVTLPDGRVLIIGGWDHSGNSLATAEAYVTASASSPGP